MTKPQPSPSPSPFYAGPTSITRERLIDGSQLAAIRANLPPGITLRSDEELDQSLDAALAHRDANDDVHVFGYGSLMWNPAFEFIDSAKAHVHGWSRKFCLWLYMARGTPQAPGLMLALDRGGACIGMAFRIQAEKARHELLLLWRREMLTGAYEARWVTAMIDDKPVRALTFVVNRKHERYVRNLSNEQIAHFLCTGKGSLGSCSDYFEATLASLHQIGIRDASLERLRSAVLSSASAGASSNS